MSTGYIDLSNRVRKHNRRENSAQLYHDLVQKLIYKSTPQRVYSTKLFYTMTSQILYSLLCLLPT